MTWRRARRPEQKAERREEILRAAKALLANQELEAISLNGIAREAGFSKPNVYRYFATREEIFLTIFEEEQNRFVDALVGRLKRLRAADPVEAISRAWVDVALRHRAWLELLPQAAITMERNSSVEEIVKFKKVGYARFGELVGALADTYPALDGDQWAAVCQAAYAMMAGLWPLSNPGENVLAAMQDPEVRQSPWEFRTLMQRSLAALIRGSNLENRA